MLDKVLANYELDPSQRSKIIAECYGGLDRKNTSITRTGPTIQQEVIRDVPHFSLDYGENVSAQDSVIQLHLEEFSDEAIDFEPMRSRVRELTQPSGNTQNWLKVFLREIEDPELCISIILDRIKFEAKHFRILRLDDHLEQMAISMGIEKKSAEFSSLVKRILDAIDPEIIKNVVVAQVTFSNPETIDFCHQNRLSTILNLQPAEFIQAVACMTQFHHTYNIINTLLLRQQNSGVSLHRYTNRIEEGDLLLIHTQYKIALDGLTTLCSTHNIQQLPISNQLELCQFIIFHSDLLEKGARLLLRADESLGDQVGKIIASAKNHLRLLSAPVIKPTEPDRPTTAQKDSDDRNDTQEHPK